MPFVYALDNRHRTVIPFRPLVLPPMNWLAHLFLSPPNDPAHRIWNLLPDLLSAPALSALPPEFQKGIALHRSIDAFTDRHPVVRSGIQRLPAPLRRFGGILCDMFYDHFLARNWTDY